MQCSAFCFELWGLVVVPLAPTKAQPGSVGDFTHPRQQSAASKERSRWMGDLYPASRTFGEAFVSSSGGLLPPMEVEPPAVGSDLDNAPYINFSSFPTSLALLQTTSSWDHSQINDLSQVLASSSTFKDIPAKTHPLSYCRNLQRSLVGHQIFAGIFRDGRSSYCLS